MFNDIGKKIKKVAKSIFIYELVLAIIIGIILIFLGVDALAGGEYLIMLGIFSIIIGPIVAWLSAFLLYGFGELVDKTCEIEFNTRHPEKDAPPQAESVPVVECKIKDKLGTRYRNICEDCRKEYDAYI